MPATSQEPSRTVRFSKRTSPAALVDERGCRRDIRSNGWIVISMEFALSKPVRQKKLNILIGVLHSVRIQRSAVSPAVLAQVRFGPDVFADALVPCRHSSCTAW